MNRRQRKEHYERMVVYLKRIVKMERLNDAEKQFIQLRINHLEGLIKRYKLKRIVKNSKKKPIHKSHIVREK